MKPVRHIALSLALSAALTSAAALAQDAAAPAADAPAPAAEAHHHKHKHADTAGKPASHLSYKSCVKEDEAVAEYYCNAHPDGCEAEKAGIAKECKGEARGERHDG